MPGLPRRDADSTELIAQRTWFDTVYGRVDAGAPPLPWDRHGRPNGLLRDWAGDLDGHGRTAVVVGCGYGDDAEFLAERGFATTAFDFSPVALAGARRRFPDSAARYLEADLFDLPGGFGTFDLVLESMTVQSLPRALRAATIAAIRALVAPGGTLLVIAGKVTPEFDESAGPWLLTRADVDAFGEPPLRAIAVEEHPGEDAPRWRAEFRRP